MKKIIYLIPMLLGFVVTSCYSDEIEDINNRLNQIEKTQIASLSEQINGVKLSLTKLEGVNTGLDMAVKSLDNLVGTLKTQLESNTSADAATKKDLQDKITGIETLIGQLTDADKTLDAKIEDLTTYVDSELSNSKSWAESTFATLTKYYELESTLLSVKELIEQTEMEITSEYTDAISNAITESETSMKTWVNKSLANSYYDMAAVDAKLLLLEDKIESDDALLSKQISDQKAALEQAVKDFDKSIQKAIAAAVAEGGTINEEIAAQVQEAMDKVDFKLAVIENTIAGLVKDIAAIRNDIASIQEQIDSIVVSIGELKTIDSQLDEYIETLSGQYETLSEAYDRLAELVDSGAGPSTGSVALEEFKAVVATQLDVIEQTLETLQASDETLQGQISDLVDYVDGKCEDTQDWVEASFATLAQFNAVSETIATIQAQMVTMSEQMEVRLATLATKEELDRAIANLSSSVQTEIQTAVENCNTAMNTMQQELTSAYQSAISTAISNSEQTMKSWVNTKLASYYTAAQTDAKITALKNNLEGQLLSQKTYLENVISDLELSLDAKIESNALLIEQLARDLGNTNSQVATLASSVSTNTQKITANAQSIKTNASSISSNASKIATNTQNITAANKLISDNNKLIKENASLIEANAKAIAALQDRATVDEVSIQSNAVAISENAEDIAANADLIAKNAAAIVNNTTAISQNAADIQKTREDLEQAKKDITEAYQKAIKEAIETSEGKLNGKIAEEVATINSRIVSEVTTINEAIEALTSRVAACEKDIKSIKTSIYNMQIEISDIQDQIEAILARIQSIEYVPQYADGKATMYYTNNGKITPGSATFEFELQPAVTATELAAVWESALSMKAVHTQTRAAVNFINMPIVSVTAEDGVLTVVASGADLSDDFYLGRISANACLVVSDGNNELASDYINMVPWTTDIIYVPDAAFKAYLVENFDADSDGEISEDEAMDIETIDLSDITTKIATLAGIEYMKNLKTLNAAYHSLTSLDLSHNNALIDVVVNNNKLKTLDLSGCSAIVSLECSGNKLTTLDVSEAAGLTDLVCSNNDLGALNLTNNKALVNLQCSGNKLATLNLKNHLALETLYCRSNSLTVLDLSKNTALKELDCSSNKLTTLNLNKNTELELVYCRSNSLTSLYLNNCGKITMLDCSKNALTTLNLNGCKSVETLNCSDNSIVTLDLTALKALETLDCSGNDLVSLDVSANSALASVYCSDNASLAKLWVKDAAHQEQITIKKDNATNVFFNAGGLVFPDKALETYMLANYDDDYDGVISIAEADNVTTVNCANKGISDLTGLESCTNLVYLNCSNNNIKVVDCHTLAKLESLSCYGNPVEVLDLTNCAVLQSLFLQNVSTNAVSGTTISVNGYDQAASLKFSVANTPFKTLTVVNSSVLTDLNVLSNDNMDVFNGYGNTALTNLSLSPYFKEVHAYGCSVLEGTDVSDISGLTVLDLHGGNLQTLNVDSNPELVTLDCSSNQLTKLNVDNNTGLVTLKVNGNNLTQFKVANNTALETLWVSDNKLSVINVRSNTALKDLRMSNNIDITALNLKSNIALETLYADGLSISEINLVENSGLSVISLVNNELLSLAYVWDGFNSYRGCMYINHNFTYADGHGATLRESYGIGSYVTPIGAPSNESGVICFDGFILSIARGSANWSGASSWCTSIGDGNWHLPSIDQLTLINLNKTLLSKVGLNLTEIYWSKSYDGLSGSNSWAFNFTDGKKVSKSDSSAQYVRAVRAL